VYGNLVLVRKEFGVVTLTGQVDPAQPQSGEALDTYLAEVTANVPNGMKTTQDDAPWQYTTIHAPEIADALGIPATQLRSKTKGALLRSALDGSQIRTTVERLTSDDCGWRGATAVFVTWGGKINALSPQDTAVAERDSVALFAVGNVWDNPEEDETDLTWNRTLYRDVFAATGGVPVPNDRTGGCYINWPDPDLLEEEWNQSGVPMGSPPGLPPCFVGRAGLRTGVAPASLRRAGRRLPPARGVGRDRASDRRTAGRRAVLGWTRRASRRWL
jgi:hypothetical protein